MHIPHCSPPRRAGMAEPKGVDPPLAGGNKGKANLPLENSLMLAPVLHGPRQHPPTGSMPQLPSKGNWEHGGFQQARTTSRSDGNSCIRLDPAGQAPSRVSLGPARSPTLAEAGPGCRAAGWAPGPLPVPGSKVEAAGTLGRCRGLGSAGGALGGQRNSIVRGALLLLLLHLVEDLCGGRSAVK